jgi:hypothetical protein
MALNRRFIHRLSFAAVVVVAFAYYCWIVTSPVGFNQLFANAERYLFGWNPSYLQIELLHYSFLSPPAFFAAACTWLNVRRLSLAPQRRLVLCFMAVLVAPITYLTVVLLVFAGFFSLF